MGFVLIYKGTGVINFAQGEAIMVAAFIAYYLVTASGSLSGLPFPSTLVAVGLAGSGHGTSGYSAHVGRAGLFRGHDHHRVEHFSAVHGRHRFRTSQLCFSQPFSHEPLHVGGIVLSHNHLWSMIISFSS